MKRLAAILFLGIFLISFSSQPCWAGEVDILIKKLAEKGILTLSEAQDLLKEIQKEAAKEKAEIEQVVQKEVEGKTFKLPKWVEKMKLKGDLRVRYQGEDRDNDNNPHRSRGRVRLRVGVESQINEQWKAGFGISTGGTSPRSTNQTLQDTFESPDLRIDYAYAQYQPFKWVKLLGGKFKNPIWGPKDLLWDGDIRPDGLAAHFKYKPLSNLELFATPGFFILEEYAADKSDPDMWAFQAGINWKFTDNMYLKLAGSIYEFDNVRGNNFAEHGAGTNSRDAQGNWLYDHDALAVDAELGFTKIPGPVPFVAVFGQYVNSDADDSRDRDGFDDDEGWLLGFKFGHKKVKKFAQWQAKYNYRRIERDAWPDFLGDSDVYGGDTSSKGHEVEFKFGIHEYVTLALDYYHTEPIRLPAGAMDQDEELIQVDLILKW